MSERICPACKAVVPPRLKFCRECGGRVDDAPAAAESAGDAGDATMMSALPRPAGSTPTTKLPEGAGDKTVIGAFTVRTVEPEPATMAPGPDMEPVTMAPGPEMEAPTIAPGGEPEPPTMAPSETDLNKTMVTPPEPPPPPPPPPPPTPSPPAAATTKVPVPTGEETILGALPTPAPAPKKAPPPPPPPPAEDPEPEPVTDDFDEGPEDAAPTVERKAVPLPAPAPQAPPPPPLPVGPLPAGGVRLEHWSPKVKTAVVTLVKPETVVGRDRGDLKFPEDNHLSKKHARFFMNEEGKLCVEDLGAINGTYLRLRAPVKLEHRDVLFIGRHAFRFELLQYEDQDDRTIEGDPLTKVQGVQGKAPRARLVKRQAEGFRGLPFFFGTHRYVLGRTDGTHNFQKDDLMSRRHAALEFKEGDYWLEDLGSQNGTYLRLRGPRPLESGDVVMMGDQYFKLP